MIWIVFAPSPKIRLVEETFSRCLGRLAVYAEAVVRHSVEASIIRVYFIADTYELYMLELLATRYGEARLYQAYTIESHGSRGSLIAR